MTRKSHRFNATAAAAALGLAALASPAQASLLGQTLTLEYGLDLGSGWQTIKSASFTVGAGIELPSFLLATSTSGSTAWSLDADALSITLDYVGTADFMNYGSPQVLGFRIVDSTGSAPSFTAVSVSNTAYTPLVSGNLIEGFNPGSALSFDADHIVVNLNSAMYHHHAMPGMGDPYRNRIALSVQVAAVPEPQAAALMLAGLGMTAWVGRRRAARKGGPR